MRTRRLAVLMSAVALSPVLRAAVDATPKPESSLADMSIEQLMNEPVTSVSKKETNLFQSPAAVAVVTDDDISRMDFTSLPEALRFVPGVDVARINGSGWAVSTRGSNSEFANDTLVLIDGRTIYSPAFGGVFWKTEGIPMQDIDRIEVIRGPGSILWGANATNGVINVIYKGAQETQGLLATVSEGTEDNPSVTVRYGGKAGDSVYYRAYVNYFDRNGLVGPDGSDAGDFSRGWRTGFRLDAAPSARDSLTVEGDAYDIHTGESVAIPRLDLASNQLVNVVSDSNGESLLGKWVRRNSPESQWSIQAFYDHDRLGIGISQDTNDTFDFEFQDRFPVGSRQDVVSGFGYRYVRDVLPPSAIESFVPELNMDHLYTAFIQDQVSLAPGRLSLIPGTKFERNGVTGLEFEPGVRLLWTPSATQTIWLGATRAIRTPALYETSLQQESVYAFPTGPGGPPGEVAVTGNPAIDRSEKVDAYEAGYRVQPTPELSLDVAVFYNFYHDLLGSGAPVTEFAPTPAPAHVLLLSTIEGGGTARSYGMEPSVQWRFSDHWRLVADYSLLRSTFYPNDSESEDNPRNQAHLRSYLDLPHGLELTAALSYVSRIVDTEAPVAEPIPSYLRVDLGLVWRPSPSLEIGVWGQNLGQSRHMEFGSAVTPVLYEVPREIATRITWRH